MRAATIIHTRTYACDFNSEFLVRPESFKLSDIQWARKLVLGATAEIDGLTGLRWLAADNGKYRMAGVVGFLDDICEKCNMSDEDREKSKALLHDNRNRRVFAFIGAVTDKRNNDGYGELTLDYLWGEYLKKIYPVWKRSYQEPIFTSFKETGIIGAAREYESMGEPVKAGGRELYEANPADDYKLFLSLLNDEDREDFAFCSNILGFLEVKESAFSIISTSGNTIQRMEKEYTAKPVIPKPQPTQNIGAEKSESGRRVTDMRDAKKKQNRLLMTVLASGSTILLLIILILLLKRSL